VADGLLLPARYATLLESLMFRALLCTLPDPSIAFVRVVLALIILPHGAQKLLGWFGGYGWDGTLAYFVSLGIPPVFGILAILAETLGALALLLGLFGRLTALAIAVNMLVAALLVHAQFGFFANWFGNQAGEGIEMLLALAAMSLVIVWRGSGAWSVDGALTPTTASHAPSLLRAAS
jgi:putative oxidoreductase